jgi:CDP-glucose 4,6-dehydratase
MRNRNVFVTGATGLVGSWLVANLLDQGATVSALILDEDPNSELIRTGNFKKIDSTHGNLTNLELLREVFSNSEFDTVFHLGAQTIVGTALENPVDTFKSNIEGTWNLLESIRTSKKPAKSIVVASSDKAYGTAETLPYKEDTKLQGEGPYDVSKSCTDLIAQSYGKTYGMPIAVARCGNIYGGGDLNWSRIVPGTIRDLIQGKQPIIRSDGTYVRDYVYVEDIAEAYIQLANHQLKTPQLGDSYNFSRDEPTSVLEIYRAICHATVGEYVEPIIKNETKSEIKDQHLDSSKARETLQWRSGVNLESGLQKTSKWYRELIG